MLRNWGKSLRYRVAGGFPVRKVLTNEVRNLLSIQGTSDSDDVKEYRSYFLIFDLDDVLPKKNTAIAAMYGSAGSTDGGMNENPAAV